MIARLTKPQVDALKAAVSTDPTRPLLNNVCIRDGVAEATNGHALVQIRVDGHGGDEHTPVIFTRDALKLPTRKTDVLNVDTETGKVEVARKDGSRIQFERRAKPVTEADPYPYTDRVFPDFNGKDKITVGLRSSVLRTLVKIAEIRKLKGLDFGRVDLTFYADTETPERAILVEHRDDPQVRGVAMPLKAKEP